MIDVALALDGIVPAAGYSGSLTDNTEAAFEAIIWEDSRRKPSWREIEGWSQPHAAQPQAIISKDDLWRRATDAEANAMWATMQAQSIRIQQIYAGATFISPDDELYATLLSALTALFGGKRAVELLARSN